MEKRKEKNGPTYVPQFGAWDNNAAAGGYTVEFSKARANKQNKPKTGLGAHHGLTTDQKQEDPGYMKNGYKSVPQFGMWDQPEGGGAASYTVEFSKARVNRKQHKTNDLLVRPPSIDHHEQEALRKQHEDSCMRKKNMLTYLNCCIRP